MNEVAKDSTNVLRTYRCLARNSDQITFYDCGVGTISNPDRITERGRRLSRLVDSALGLSVRANVIQAYLFLVRHYQPGDRIYLFGFSRGAYTVRAVAGMIHFLGLLRPELQDLGDLAWSVYSGENVPRSVRKWFRGANRFRNSFGIDQRVTIHFVGVWDTVSSFGWFGDLRTLPRTANNPSIVHVRHALAIDERRAMFQANHFRPRKLGQHETFKEVWFAGCHSDVGGGHDEKDGTISKVSLEWMLREAESLGLFIDSGKRRHLLNQPPDHPQADPLGEIHESLKGHWHLAELLPLRSYSGEAGKKRWKRPHLWARRKIGTKEPRPTKPILHTSVVERIRARSDYRPLNLPAAYDVEL
jgi:uncharacterized protein (DUF2235 family)